MNSRGIAFVGQLQRHRQQGADSPPAALARWRMLADEGALLELCRPTDGAPKAKSRVERDRQNRRQRRVDRYNEVVGLHRKGYPEKDDPRMCSVGLRARDMLLPWMIVTLQKAIIVLWIAPSVMT